MDQQLIELKKAIQAEDTEKVEQIFASVLSGEAGGDGKEKVLREVQHKLNVIELEQLEGCLELLKEIQADKKDMERRLRAIGAVKD